MDSLQPGLVVHPPRAGVPVTAVVLVLNGGSATNLTPASRRNLAYLRMVPFARVVHRDLHAEGVAVWQLRYRVRGWNKPALDPVRDAKWALERIAAEHPGVPVILIGHSMGGRTALHTAGAEQVVGVCALAPWVEPGDPVAQVAGRTLVIAHGDLDRMTNPRSSRAFAVAAVAAGAKVAYFVVVGEKHAMLHRARDWHVLARDSVRTMLGMPGTIGQSGGGQIAEVLARSPSERLDVPLARTRHERDSASV